MGGKDGFKVLVFMVFLNQKPRKVGFFVFNGFLDTGIVVFLYRLNYALKPYSYYFFIII